MKKKLLSALLVMILVLSIVPCAVFAEETAPFSGTRTVTLTADTSYLENYFMGGRQAVDLALRRGAPQWLTYRLSTKNRDISLEMAFEFTSQEDYVTKLQALLLYTPGIYHETGSSITLMESYSALELLSFIQAAFPTTDFHAEKTLADIFAVTDNRITLAGEEYIAETDTICIRPNDAAVIRADGLTVETELNKKGGYERTIEVLVTKTADDDSRLEQFEEQFEAVGDVSTEADTVSVTFSANNDSQLTGLTIACLQTINSINENAFFVDEQTVGVTRTEIFDLDTLLTEGAPFRYTFTYPKEYKSLTTQNESITLDGNTVTATDQEILVIDYQCGFRFSRIESHTDLTDPLGRITKTIRFYAPVNIASAYHNRIKAEFQARLCDGTTFNIYDQGSLRCFEFLFSTWYPSQMEKFDQAVFGSDSNSFRVNRTFFPYGENQLQDNLQPDNAISNMLWAETIVRTYTFSAGTNFPSAEEAANRTREGNIVTITDSGSATIAFVGFNFFVSLIYSGILILLVILVLMILAKIKKARLTKEPKPKKEKTPKAKAAAKTSPPQQTPAELPTEPVAEPTEPQPPAQDRAFCHNCNAPLTPGTRFCGICGTKQS